jgi:hypothetical protein
VPSWISTGLNDAVFAPRLVLIAAPAVHIVRDVDGQFHGKGQSVMADDPTQVAKPGDDLAKEQVSRIMNLVGEIVQLGEGYKIHPPAEATADPSILTTDEAATKLRGSKWWLKFANGREELLTFEELLFMTANQIMVVLQLREKRRQGQSGKISVSFKVAFSDVMAPASVKALLGKMELEGLRRIEKPTFPQIKYPVYGIQAAAGALLSISEQGDESTGVLSLFTGRTTAESFAKKSGMGKVVPIAANLSEFQQVLKSMSNLMTVAFDAVLVESGGVKFGFNVPRADLLTAVDFAFVKK